MKPYQDIIAHVEAAEEGAHIGAFFDFDRTIINGFSAFTFIREQLRAGHLSVDEFIKLSQWLVSFGFGSMDFANMLALSSQFLKDMPEDEIETFSRLVHEKHIAREIYPESRALIEAHLKKGHTVAIISSATQYQVKYAAQDLNIKHCFSSMLEIENNKMTGRIGSSCYGQGKAKAAKSLAAEKDLDLIKSYFYSDGDEDLPLLHMVGHPRPVNPNRTLTKVAKQQGWPILRFNSRGMPGFQRTARSIGAYSSVIGAFMAAVPVLAMTRSLQKARNFSTPLFADSAAMLIGLELKVINEQNLWSHRPGVFIFNHQSNSDTLIMASLMRKNFVSIGKQEIKRIPVLGQIMQLAGVIMIDRKSTSSSISAMRPVVDAIKNDGMSLVISPEGTRSTSKRLSKFKKGAFHIAMQAKAPIIPVVIHNTIDVAPKGQFTFSPSVVEVEILEPVLTDDWQVDDIQQHIDAIQAKYTEALNRKSGSVTIDGQAVEQTAQQSIAAPAKTKKQKAPASKAPTKKTARKKATTPKKASAKKKVAKKKITKHKEATKKVAVKKTTPRPTKSVSQSTAEKTVQKNKATQLATAKKQATLTTTKTIGPNNASGAEPDYIRSLLME